MHIDYAFLFYCSHGMLLQARLPTYRYALWTREMFRGVATALWQYCAWCGTPFRTHIHVLWHVCGTCTLTCLLKGAWIGVFLPM